LDIVSRRTNKYEVFHVQETFTNTDLVYRETVRLEVGRLEGMGGSKMKYYSISFPGECGQDVLETWSEKQILSSGWYKNWILMMVQGDKAHLIHDQSAIDDWCVVHWAVEVEKPGWTSGWT